MNDCLIFLTEIWLAATLNTSTQIQGSVLKSTGVSPDLVSHHSPVYFRGLLQKDRNAGIWLQRADRKGSLVSPLIMWLKCLNLELVSWRQTSLILPSLEPSKKTMQLGSREVNTSLYKINWNPKSICLLETFTLCIQCHLDVELGFGFFLHFIAVASQQNHSPSFRV